MLPKKIFFCYAHEDEALLNKLKTHLQPLQKQKLISIWHDRDISAGTEWEQEINQHLNTAEIILLLVSPDFMALDYCYGIEMLRAIERHDRGEAKVIPIILRPVHWEEALLNIARSLHNAIGEKKAPVVNTPSSTTQTNIPPKEPNVPPMQPQPSPHDPISQQQVLHTSATKSVKTRKPKPAEVTIFFNVLFIGTLTPMFMVFKFNWLTISIGVIILVLDVMIILGLIFDAPSRLN